LQDPVPRFHWYFKGEFNMSNAEEGIARVQLAQKGGLKKLQKRGIDNLNSRVSTLLLAFAFLGLILVWATSSSPYVIYGSFAALMLIVVLTGVIRVKRIQRLREQRALQAKEAQSESST
jgi:hypothetical protein